MQSVDSNLQAAGASQNRQPISEIVIEDTRPHYVLLDSNSVSLTKSLAVAKMFNGNILAVRIAVVNVTGTELQKSIITAPGTFSQWTSWTTLATPAIASDVAIWASGTDGTIDVYYFSNSTTLRRIRSTDYGVTFAAAETVATVTNPSGYWLHAATARSNECFYTDFFSGEYADIKRAIYSAGWTSTAWPHRHKSKFSDKYNRIAAIEIGNRALVVYSPGWDSSDTDIHATWYENNIWSRSWSLVPLDTESSPNARRGVVLQKVNNEAWLSFVSRIPQYSGASVSNVFQSISLKCSADGTHWTETDFPAEINGSYFSYFFTSGNYVYLVALDPNGEAFWIYQAKGTSLTGNQHADVYQDVSNYVISWSTSLPESSPGSGTTLLSNRDASFNTSQILRAGALLKRRAGYKVGGANYLADVSREIIDEPRQDTGEVRNEFTISSFDYAKRLNDWRAEREYLYNSQFKLYDKLSTKADNGSDLSNIRTWRGTWTITDADKKLKAATVAGGSDRSTALVGIPVVNCAQIQAKVRYDSALSGMAGFAVRVQGSTASENGYLIVYNPALGHEHLELYREVGSAWSAELTQSAALTWAAATWYWIAATTWYGKLLVYYSTDGITWNPAFTYTDADTTGIFITGYMGFEVKGNTSSTVSFSELMINDMTWDLSIEDVAVDVLRLSNCKLDAFLDALVDSFTAMSTANWPSSTGAWVVTGGRVGGSAATVDAWAFLRSKVTAKNLIADFEIEVPAGQEAGVMVRATSNLAAGHIIALDPANSRVKLYMWSGSATLVRSFPISQTLGSGPYHIRVSCQEKYVSMWVNNLLVLTYYVIGQQEGYFCLAAKGTTASYFDNVHISELNDLIDGLTIDTNKTGAAVFQDLLDKRHIRWFFRPDGSFRASRFADRTAGITYQHSLIECSKVHSDRWWVSHVRVVGASDIGDKLDLELLSDSGYRFQQIDNPDVMTPSECYDEASYILNDGKQLSQLREFIAAAQVAQERQDLIKIVNAKDGTGTTQEFIVTAISFEYDSEGLFDMRLSGKLAIEWLQREIRKQKLKAFEDGIIKAINTVLERVDVYLTYSGVWLYNCPVASAVNIANLKIDDHALLGNVNGTYFLFGSYRVPTESKIPMGAWGPGTDPAIAWDFRWNGDTTWG